MTKPKEKNYVAIAARYAGDVVSGKILACHWTIKAWRRQIDDLEKAKSKSYPYRFDREKASRICRFIERLPHIKGKWAKDGARIELQPWQIFILTTVFGWVRSDTGLRRFKTVLLEMPRKQGKSSLSSGVGLYCLCLDEESGGEIYSAATTRDQAKIVWQDAWHMVERSPGLKKAFGVSTMAHAISQISTASWFQALSAEGNSLDGCAIGASKSLSRTSKAGQNDCGLNKSARLNACILYNASTQKLLRQLLGRIRNRKGSLSGLSSASADLRMLDVAAV